ncbi:MAG: DUF1501 domain-containing protein [Pseudomonadota bacterium]
MYTRRDFLNYIAGGMASAIIGARSVFAAAPTDNRMIVLFLRGGLDGLHALAPYMDPDYKRLRPMLVRASDRAGGLIDLDGYFGMHPALEPLIPLYRAKELLFIPAASTQYRDRSHFDGQNLLENGSGAPHGADTGWLNRAILGLNAGDRRLGLSIGPAIPLILQGDARVQTWAKSRLPEVDEDFLNRLMRSYRHDALFMDALHDARGALRPNMDMAGADNGWRQGDSFPLAARAAADLLSHPDGPRIGVIEFDGWDTHFDQNRRLSSLLQRLSQGLVELKTGLGSEWSRTTVLVVSEFGRTAAENGSRGTDHGTGGLAMLAGGAVAGGRIVGDWPGLSNSALWQGRDVRSVNSYEALFKDILMTHLGLDEAYVETQVFPNSRAFQPMGGLLRKA